MDLTYVDGTGLKNLEDMSVFLATGILSLNTLHNMQVRALEIGILPEDAAERSNTMIWDLRRLMNLYQEQLETVWDLLPEEFNAQETIKKLQQQELKKARSMTRKKKE